MIQYASNLNDAKDKFLHSGLVCVKNASIEFNKEIAVALGKPFKYDTNRNPERFLDDGYILRVSNVDGILSDLEVSWHQDHSHKPGIWYGTVIHGLKNSFLADTEFSDLELAYEDLSNSIKSEIDDMTMIQRMGIAHENKDAFDLEVCDLDKANYRLFTRPTTKKVVIEHPVRKTKMLFLSPRFASVENKDLFNYLVKHATQPKYLFTFKWNDGDCLIIDNLKFMHRRNAFTGTRVLLRTLFTYD